MNRRVSTPGGKPTISAPPSPDRAEPPSTRALADRRTSNGIEGASDEDRDGWIEDSTDVQVHACSTSRT